MPYVIILIVVVLLRTFIITPIIVNGESMNPTLKEKQILILNKYDKKYNRGDIVVVNYFNGEKEERLKKLVDAGRVAKVVDKKKSYFSVI